jgi:hypothetical protein
MIEMSKTIMATSAAKTTMSFVLRCINPGVHSSTRFQTISSTCIVQYCKVITFN